MKSPLYNTNNPKVLPQRWWSRKLEQRLHFQKAFLQAWMTNRDLPFLEIWAKDRMLQLPVHPVTIWPWVEIGISPCEHFCICLNGEGCACFLLNPHVNILLLGKSGTYKRREMTSTCSFIIVAWMGRQPQHSYLFYVLLCSEILELVVWPRSQNQTDMAPQYDVITPYPLDVPIADILPLTFCHSCSFL